MEMTIDAFANKAVKYGYEVLMNKFKEPKNRYKLAAKLYFAKKVIAAHFADETLIGTVINDKGMILLDELEACAMEGFKYAEAVPFQGLCDMRMEDAQEFFAYMKGTAA
jgi:hypothetical protein